MQEINADLSYDPNMVAIFLKTLETGNDVVIGSRYAEGGGAKNWELSRKLISRGGSLYTRAFLGMRVKDLTGGYNLGKKEVLVAINLDGVRSEGSPFR